jgi:glycyl-tRNA synthetase beta chain
MVKNALLEIGTEELPASYIEPALRQMTQLAEKLFAARGLAVGRLTTYATPRRLTLYIGDLAEKSADRVEEATGPAAKAGRDAAGNFTMAAKGFAAKHGIPPEKLETKMTEKGEYLCVRTKIPGEKTERILPAIFTELVTKIYFPKTMTWEASHFRFARPLRSLLALYGDKVVRFAVAGVKAGNTTRGLHTITAKKIAVKSPDAYAGALRNNCILADVAERREVILKNIETTAKRARGTALTDPALVDEVNFLVEHPVAVLGHFDEKYLKLPPEVLITCLKKKQKCFAIQSEGGALSNSFIGIRNGISEHQETVREGYERVLTARLADAEFFFKKDTQTTLASKTERLKGVRFQEKLGSVYDKTRRIEQIAVYLAGLFEPGSPYHVAAEDIRAAAALAKADLTTDMVFEYPELQGVIGRIYAQHDGAPVPVSRAVEEHYWPLTAEGALPQEPLAVILSLADKIDTLVGDFAVGLIPTGSQDPYGLRRLGTGIVRIILEKELPVPLDGLVRTAFALLPEPIRMNTGAPAQVMDFFGQRLENLWTAGGFRFDEIRAVMASGFGDVQDAARRLAALKQIRAQADFAPLAGAFKRASNILRQAEKQHIAVPEAVREDLFREDAERDLARAAQQMAAEIQALLERRDYAPALQKMVGLKGEVDRFFDKVMVMAEDEAVRANRLAILRYTTGLFFRILDFSLLQG